MVRHWILIPAFPGSNPGSAVFFILLPFYSKKTPTSKVGDWEINCVCYLLDRAS